MELATIAAIIFITIYASVCIVGIIMLRRTMRETRNNLAKTRHNLESISRNLDTIEQRVKRD